VRGEGAAQHQACDHRDSRRRICHRLLVSAVEKNLARGNILARST